MSTTIDPYPSGVRIDLLHPDPAHIHVEDIAWALAKECRFANHIKMHYSVAEHCIHVSNMVSRVHALRGLLHDGSEYLLRDLPKPVKVLCPGYETLERRIQQAIYLRFDIDPDEELGRIEVKRADRRLYSHENVVLRGGHGEKLPTLEVGLWDPEEACKRYLARFKELW